MERLFAELSYETSNRLSNCCNTSDERQATWPLTLALIDMVRPKKIVLIGRDTAGTLAGGDVPVFGAGTRQGGQSISSRRSWTSTQSSSGQLEKRRLAKSSHSTAGATLGGVVWLELKF